MVDFSENLDRSKGEESLRYWVLMTRCDWVEVMTGGVTRVPVAEGMTAARGGAAVTNPSVIPRNFDRLA